MISYDTKHLYFFSFVKVIWGHLGKILHKVQNVYSYILQIQSELLRFERYFNLLQNLSNHDFLAGFV